MNERDRNQYSETMPPIQYASDLHLEFFGTPPDFTTIVKPVAPYLVLAGDIGQPGHHVFHQFLDYVAVNWRAVILIAGNHEYYTTQPQRKWNARWNTKPPRTMFETQEYLKAACVPYPNLYFLHTDSPVAFFPDDNLVFIGLTLWSWIPDDILHVAATSMNDYSYIPVGGEAEERRPLDPHTSREIHTRERAVLEAQIAEWSSRGAEIIVVTHHMPSFGLIAPQYTGSVLNCCFASDCEPLLRDGAVRAWIYGHSHAAGCRQIGATVCAINARGYPRGGTAEVAGYSSTAILREPRACVGSTVVANEEVEFL